MKSGWPRSSAWSQRSARASTVAAIVDRLTRLGWKAAIEVSFSIWGERGSIDVLAWHAATETLLVIEVKSVVADLQSLLHGLDRKTRLAPDIAAERGWRPRSVACLVVLAEIANLASEGPATCVDP